MESGGRRRRQARTSPSKVPAFNIVYLYINNKYIYIYGGRCDNDIAQWNRETSVARVKTLHGT